jgi:dTDP-4-dehydrorhamnose reductase
MKILVTGANGQLGNEIRLRAKRSSNTFIFTDLVEQEGVETVKLDITDVEAVTKMVKENEIDVIVNCAAYTNVDKAETDEALCHKLNAEAPKMLAHVMKKAKGMLLHISTDYVFGGDSCNIPCTEDMKGKPTGVYGKTKLEGEKNIISSGVNYVIIRTAWLYSEYGKNFVKTMMNLTATRPTLNVVFDQVGTPTYAGDLADAIMRILLDYKIETAEEGASTGAKKYSKMGIYNYSNEGVCSWYDFAIKIAKKAGNKNCSILPCHSDEFPSPVKRPPYSVLDKTKIKQTFDLKVPYWTSSLKKCMKNIMKK